MKARCSGVAAHASASAGRRPTAAQARRRVEALRAQIRHHDYRYYVQDRPTISDAAYDLLMQELKQLEVRFPTLVTPDSPTQRVAGQTREGFRMLAHHAPMLSLDSTTDADAVRQFDSRVRAAVRAPVRYVLEPKFDGLSIEVVYRDGTLVAAATRGDGERGEDVTANVRTIRAVPLRLRTSAVPAPSLLAVRGEALMRRADFAALNERLQRAGQPLFANPRNAAAGSVRQLDSGITAARKLDVRFYDVLRIEGRQRAARASEFDQWMREWGLRTSLHRRLGSTAADILAYRERLAVARASFDVEIDGVVAKVDDLGARDRIGSTANHPRWAIGLKFAARSATTRLESIDVQVGRTGVLTPVAVLRPVALGGVTVTRATLHNWTELARKQLRIGDMVDVARAGDVIPEVVGRAARSRRGATVPRPPTTCPACGARVLRRGPFRVCPNTLGCPAQCVRAIQHFASRRAFDIDGLGPSSVHALVEAGLVRTAADLFTLTADDLRGLPRFGAAAANRLAAAIQSKRRVDLDRFLLALGIPSVGAATAKSLAKQFKTLAALRRAGAAPIAATAGVGPAAAREIAAFFRGSHGQQIVDALLRHGVTVLPYRIRGGGTLAGRTIVFTGRLDRMTRSDAARLVERLGGRTSDQVTRASDLVVAGSAPGSKLDRARRRGIPIISEQEFLRRSQSEEERSAS